MAERDTAHPGGGPDTGDDTVRIHKRFSVFSNPKARHDLGNRKSTGKSTGKATGKDNQGEQNDE